MDTLKKLGSKDIYANITLRELDPPRKDIQKAYKEMKEINFPGTILDYFRYISTMFLFYITKLSLPKQSSQALNYIIILQKYHIEDVKNYRKLYAEKPAIVRELFEEIFGIEVDKFQFDFSLKNFEFMETIDNYHKKKPKKNESLKVNK